jgi:hypothetical protein
MVISMVKQRWIMDRGIWDLKHKNGEVYTQQKWVVIVEHQPTEHGDVWVTSV